MLIICALAFSCSSDDEDSNRFSNPELIFGWFADSLCSGDCATIYRIDDQGIYRDIDNNYPGSNNFQGNFVEVTNAEYQDLYSLINQLPNQLLDEPSGYLDCLDCTDEQGGFYLQFQSDDYPSNTWKFRNAQYPNYMENYRSLLVDKLAELNSL